MRAVLIGADLMYRQDGKLVPIEINTNTAWDAENRVEEFDDCFDFDSFNAFLELHNIEEVWVDGLLSPYLIRYFGSKGINIVQKATRELEEAEDRDDLLLLRTSYSDEALVDAFCRDKDLFLEAIKNLEAGCEFILKDSAASWKGEITNLPDNGDYPNLIIKYRYPYYNRAVYPKLVKVSSQEELTALLESDEVPEDYLIMPFYYNADHLYDEDGSRRMKLFRHLSMFALVDDSLEAVPVGTYTKLCGDLTNVQCEYSELGVLDKESRNVFLNNWYNRAAGDVLAEKGDLVLMADDTWKPVEELAAGDEIKSLDIPTKGGANIKNHIEDYNISFDELEEGSTYTINTLTGIQKFDGFVSKVKMTFSDGTDWWDIENSSYPTIDPEDGTVWFRTLDMLEVGDKIVLLKADDLEDPVFEEKEIASIEKERRIVEGYQLGVNGSHLFLTKTQDDAGAYISIEHNDLIRITPAYGTFGGGTILGQSVKIAAVTTTDYVTSINVDTNTETWTYYPVIQIWDRSGECVYEWNYSGTSGGNSHGCPLGQGSNTQIRWKGQANVTPTNGYFSIDVKVSGYDDDYDTSVHPAVKVYWHNGGSTSSAYRWSSVGVSTSSYGGSSSNLITLQACDSALMFPGVRFRFQAPAFGFWPWAVYISKCEQYNGQGQSVQSGGTHTRLYYPTAAGTDQCFPDR